MSAPIHAKKPQFLKTPNNTVFSNMCNQFTDSHQQSLQDLGLRYYYQHQILNLVLHLINVNQILKIYGNIQQPHTKEI